PRGRTTPPSGYGAASLARLQPCAKYPWIGAASADWCEGSVPRSAPPELSRAPLEPNDAIDCTNSEVESNEIGTDPAAAVVGDRDGDPINGNAPLVLVGAGLVVRAVAPAAGLPSGPLPEGPPGPAPVPRSMP